MRLGQLSRKINVSYTVILDFLEKELDVHINASINAKIDSEYVEKVIEHFSPNTIAEPLKESEDAEVVVESSIEDESSVVAEKKEVIEEEIELDDNEITDENPELTIDKEEKNSGVETIRAKAEKLEGLKVIGKIDLPPPPPPEMIEIDGVMYDKAEIKQQRKEEKEQRKQEAIKRREHLKKQASLRELERENTSRELKENYHAKTKAEQEISFEAARKQAEAELARRKKREEKRRREKQRKHYEEKHLIVKEKVPKAKKVKKEKVETLVVSKEQNEPKGAFAKFWKWLTTY